MFEYAQEPHGPLWISVSRWQPRARKVCPICQPPTPALILANYGLLSMYYSLSPSETPPGILILNSSFSFQTFTPPRAFWESPLTAALSSLICSLAVFTLLPSLSTDNTVFVSYNIFFMPQISKWLFRTSYSYFMFLTSWLLSLRVFVFLILIF